MHQASLTPGLALAQLEGPSTLDSSFQQTFTCSTTRAATRVNLRFPFSQMEIDRIVFSRETELTSGKMNLPPRIGAETPTQRRIWRTKLR